MARTRPASNTTLNEIKIATKQKTVLQEIIHRTPNWTHRERSIKRGIKAIFSNLNLSFHYNLIWFQDRIVIPEKLRPELLRIFHNGHLKRERKKIGTVA